MRVTAALLAGSVLVGGLIGCGGAPDVDKGGQPQRMAQYRRIAIVCAPGQGADPSHARVILDNVKANIPSRLGFLDACDTIPDASVDTTVTPPKANLPANAAGYDGVVCLVYECGAGRVILHMYLVDAKTGAQAWYYNFDSKDADIVGRLRKHGHWVPTTIKLQCFGVR